jgi:hypothetical protein
MKMAALIVKLERRMRSEFSTCKILMIVLPRWTSYEEVRPRLRKDNLEEVVSCCCDLNDVTKLFEALECPTIESFGLQSMIKASTSPVMVSSPLERHDLNGFDVL